MGREPSNFVPVKYGTGIEDQDDQQRRLFTLLRVGGVLFAIMSVLFPKSGNKGAAQKKTPGSGFGGGGGGLNDVMNMGKSNAQVFGVDKKMRTRFKHVAGMQNAKTEV